MDIKNLQCFIAVAEHLNFSRAAESLYISQPSLSIRISALEAELGVKLFQRTHQQVYLTDEGAVLLPAVRDILERIRQLSQLVKESLPAEPEPAELLIGIDVTEDRALPIIENTLSSFQKRYPKTSIKVMDISVDEYEEKLLQGDMDFCMMVLQDQAEVNPAFLSIPLLSEPMVMVTMDPGGRSVEELIRTREAQLLFEGARGQRWNRQYLEFLRSYKPDIQPTYVENPSLLCLNLSRGKVISFLPKTYAESALDGRLSMIPVEFPQGCDITLTLLWKKDNIKPAIQLMINEFAANRAGGRKESS